MFVVFAGLETFKERRPQQPSEADLLDCEMVTCEGGAKELVRVCAVESDCNVRTHYPISPTFDHICGVVLLSIPID